MRVWFPSVGDLLEEGMATHSGILVWRFPWTEEPGGLRPIESQSQIRLKWLSTSTVSLGGDLATLPLLTASQDQTLSEPVVPGLTTGRALRAGSAFQQQHLPLDPPSSSSDVTPSLRTSLCLELRLTAPPWLTEAQLSRGLLLLPIPKAAIRSFPPSCQELEFSYPSSNLSVSRSSIWGGRDVLGLPGCGRNSLAGFDGACLLDTCLEWGQLLWKKFSQAVRKSKLVKWREHMERETLDILQLYFHFSKMDHLFNIKKHPSYSWTNCMLGDKNQYNFDNIIMYSASHCL